MSTTNTILIIAGLFTGLLMPILTFSQPALKDLSASSAFMVVMQVLLGGVLRPPARLRARDGVDAGAGRGAGCLARERERWRSCS